MPSIRYGFIVVLMIVGLSACSSDEEPPPRTGSLASFEPNPLGERVFEAYRQTGIASHSLTLPEGSREVGVNLDCAGSKGTLKVGFSSVGGAEIECSPSKGSGGIVYLAGNGSLLNQKQEVTITGSNDQQWSVAIDAGPKLTTN